jgi:hypothetical protein
MIEDLQGDHSSEQPPESAPKGSAKKSAVQGVKEDADNAD